MGPVWRSGHRLADAGINRYGGLLRGLALAGWLCLPVGFVGEAAEGDRVGRPLPEVWPDVATCWAESFGGAQPGLWAGVAGQGSLWRVGFHTPG